MKRILFLLIASGLFTCTKTAPTMVYPGAEWIYASPESQGIRESAMMEALEYLKSKSFYNGNDELMIIRNGRVIFAGDSINNVHNIWSCTKTFTSTVLGLMIRDGFCKLDDPVSVYEPLLQTKYPDVTFMHFVTMTSGYNAVGQSRWNEDSHDWSRTPYVPDEPLFLPGTQYAYWDEAMMMLGRTLTGILGRTMKSYLDETAMDPIDFGAWEWGNEGEINGIPINNGCTNIHISAAQLARFGHLFLNKGKWKGQELIPEDWVINATSVQVPAYLPVADTDRQSVMGSGSYGFNWWVNGGLSALPDAPPGTYYASGLNHNVCFVIPEWDMVIVRMGTDGNPPEGKHIVWNEFIKRLSPALSVGASKSKNGISGS